MTIESPILKLIREFVAVGRAELARPHSSEGDPDGQRALVRDIRVTDANGEPLDLNGPLAALLAPRAVFFDDLLLRAIEGGVTQVVNVGAGYDDRALRFRRTGIVFFELDLPHVVDDKRRRLAQLSDQRPGPVLLATDLSNDDVGELLADAGLDARKPTLFIAEHVLLFIDGDAVRRLLQTLSDVAAPRSLLALTLELHPTGLDSRQLVSRVDKGFFSDAGLMRSIQSREEWTLMLEESGWCWQRQDDLNAIDHFSLDIDGSNVQIRTAFVAAGLRESRPRSTGA